MKNIIFLIIFFSFSQSIIAADEEERWAGEIPPQMKDRDLWSKLIEEMLEENLIFGAVVAAERMLNFLDDKESMELAYKTLIAIIDKGYPYSLLSAFIPNQVSLQDQYYSQSYNTYKAIISLERNMEKWADDYLKSVNREDFSKYLFFRAVQNYSKNDLSESRNGFDSVLSNTSKETPDSLRIKAARNLARIHYELGEFKESFDIYENFLLRLNPVHAGDWLEAAWTLYRLGKYERALGFLYNLESAIAEGRIYLESYVLRALINVKYCNLAAVRRVNRSFLNRFGVVVRGIRSGAPIHAFPHWSRIVDPRTQSFRRQFEIIQRLMQEEKALGRLSPSVRVIARQLYSSEKSKIRIQAEKEREKAVQILSSELVYLAEGLKFLSFEAVRSRFDPSRLFVNEEVPSVLNQKEGYLEIHWPQFGDFWRDERLLLKGKLVDQCQ